jgi:ATP-dependent RNA helicase RhlB
MLKRLISRLRKGTGTGPSTAPAARTKKKTPSAASHTPNDGSATPRRRRRPRRSGGEAPRGASGRTSDSAAKPRAEAPSGRRRSRGGRGRSAQERAPRPKAAPAAPRVVAAEPWDAALFQVPPLEGQVRFHDFALREELMHAIYDLGFQYCTPVQAETLPATMQGRDVTGRAQTGTGKTAAFLIQIFQRFLDAPLAERKPGAPRALILAPTRELVMQIVRDADALGRYCPFRTLAVFGGSELEQQRAAVERDNPEVIVATPGRLIDFSNRRTVNLGQVEILVIDEADRMLDMGFIPDVRRIVYSTPHKNRRQTMFFSATLNDTVRRLATSWTREPVHVDIEPEQVTVDTINQIVYIVTVKQKFALLVNILRHEHLQRVLLFANRRDTAATLNSELRTLGINCALISGALPQDKRTKTLQAFREGRVQVLVATDVASRGLHIDDIGHVINFNIPQDPEDYVHRIGRTGRAGARGTSITFACDDEAMDLPAVEAYIGRALPCTHPPEDWLTL